MPSRNVVREFDSDAYYHIYNRGVEKRRIFLETADYIYFLGLLERHLSKTGKKDKSGRIYKQYKNIHLLAYCLMSNHFHLLIYQDKDPQEFSKFLQSVSTAYTMYFNKKYKRVGHLFQERFKASRITRDNYLEHISRYIHLNPSKPFKYRWSSLQYYLGEYQSEWLQHERILSMFAGVDAYRNFVMDYQENKLMLDELKYELANT